jgi:hypothetical protein
MLTINGNFYVEVEGCYPLHWFEWMLRFPFHSSYETPHVEISRRMALRRNCLGSRHDLPAYHL